MHCFRCITSNGISCDSKCWKHILSNAHSSIDLRTILWMTIWFGMWNFNTFHFKRNNWNPTCNDVAQMMVELAVYGLVAGLCEKYISQKHEMTKLYMSLIIAMLAGRIVNGLFNTCILSTQDYTLSVFMMASFVTCLPGVILQFIVIPVLVRSLNKNIYKQPEKVLA